MATQTTHLNTEPRLWKLRAWQYAFPASALSRSGDVFFDITVVLWIGAGIGRGETWAPAAVSGVFIAAAVCVLIIGPIAGVVVDRRGGQQIIQWANLVQFAAMASLILPASHLVQPSDELLLAWIYAAVLVTNAAGQFYNQARVIMIAVTIPETIRVSAFSAQNAATGLISIVVPALAAPIYFVTGAPTALAINATSFLASGILHSRISWKSPIGSDQEGISFFKSLRAGVAAVASNRTLVCLVIAITTMTLGSGIVTVLELFFVTDVLGAQPATLGLMSAVFAFGTLGGVFLAPRLHRKWGSVSVFLWGTFLCGVLTIAYACNHQLVPAVILFATLGLPLGAVNVLVAPMAMASIPQELLGRSMAALSFFPTVASLIAMAGAGWLVSGPMQDLDVTSVGIQFGPVNTLFLVCGLLFAGVALAIWRPIRHAAASNADDSATA